MPVRVYPRWFTSPQLNTWIELTYHQNQKDILAYVKSMVAHGIEPGVLMIDDTWQTGYGDWRFDATRFPDPKAMICELHDMGFKVMLWMCPYVGMDTPAFRRIAWGQNPDDVRGYASKGGFLLAEPLPRVFPERGFFIYLCLLCHGKTSLRQYLMRGSNTA